MLRNLGIRSKLLAVLAVPLVVLVALSTLVVHQAFTETVAAQRVESLTATTGEVNQLVHALQRERSLSGTLMYGGPDTAVSADLDKARAATDSALKAVNAVLDEAPVSESPAELADAVQKASDRHDQLAITRRAIDAGGYGAIDAHLDFYTQAIAIDLDLTTQVAAMTDDTELGRNLRAFNQLGEVVEASWQERDILVRAFGERALGATGFAQAAGFAATQDRGLSAYAGSATAAQLQRLKAAQRTFDSGTVAAARQAAAELVTKARTQIPSTWTEVADSRIGALTALEAPMTADLAERAAGVVDSARQQAMLTAFATLFAAFAALGLALVLARRLVGPVRRLTAVATTTAESLPTMIDQMQAPGARPDIAIEHIPVDSTDEIGQLAEAFNAVNDVTVKVAHDQAALRASIAEMFVNVARRNQVLLSRQLNHIDEMEAHEEDPDTLENLFRIDHLATRMRRNAESLLVLAGIDANRRLRSPMPLTDVVRSAISEIESFDRVDLAPSVDAPLTGRVAMTAAHLLAELIENATHFSNPDTRVVVATGPAKEGVEVTITDYGLGMSQDDIDEANEKIANPPVGDIAIAQRLGFFVVGRLAQRLEATVRLRRGRSVGTVVSVLLPAELFVPGSLPHTAAPAPAESAATSPVGATAPAEAAPVATAPVTSAPVKSATVVPDPVAARSEEAAPVGPPPLVVLPAQSDKVSARGLLPRRRRRRSAPAAGGPETAPEPVTAPVEPVPASEPAAVEPAATGPEPVPTAPAEAVPAVPLEPEPVAKVEPEPVAKPEPEPAAPSEASSDSETTPEPKIELEPEITPEPEPVAEVAPTATIELEPEITPEPVAEVAPTAKVELEPEVTPKPDLQPERSDQRSVAAALRELAAPTPAASASSPTTADAGATKDTDATGTTAATAEASAAERAEATDTSTSHASATTAEPAAPVGLPALDILPGRHRVKPGRRFGLFRRGGQASAPAAEPTITRLPRRTTTVTPPPVSPVTPERADHSAAPAASTSSGAGLGGFAPSPFGATTPAPASTTPTTTPATPAAAGGGAATLFGRPVPPSPFGRRSTSEAPAGGAQPSEPIPLTRRQPATVGADVAGAARGGDDFMATRSALASQALSELSRLNSSSYTPAAVVGERPAPLTRRVPRRSSPAAQAPEETSSPSERRRTRNAEEVRNRLSGFRAGVERGRGETVPAGATAAAGGGASGPSGGGGATASGTTTNKQTRRSTTKEEKR